MRILGRIIYRAIVVPAGVLAWRRLDDVLSTNNFLWLSITAQLDLVENFDEANKADMSMLLALLTVPALLATNEAIRQGQSKDRKEEHRARRSNLIISCSDPSPLSREIDHRQVALKNSRVCLLPSSFNRQLR